MSFTYLKDYSNFSNVAEMDEHVASHAKEHYNKLKPITREVLFNIAKHALKFVGATHLKVETIANEIKVSTKSVYRAVKELSELNIIKKENKPKLNGIKGANIYSILPYVPSSVPSDMSSREEAEKPCESKVEAVKNEGISLSLNTPLSLKDTNITKKHAEKDSVDKELLKKKALIEKLPSALTGLSIYSNDSDMIYKLVSAMLAAKNKVSHAIKFEEHEALFRKVIRSVYEYWTRQVRKGNEDYNVFGLMYKAVKELCERILDGSAYQVKENTYKAQQRKFENVPAWMEDKVKVFKNGRSEMVPDWFENRNEEVQQVIATTTENVDFATAQAEFQARLAELQTC